MPLNKRNTKTFHRYLYAGQLEKITLLKRGDDLQEGQLRSLTIYQARRSMISKRGEPLQGDMAVGTAAVWHIPRSELERVGVQHINVLDRFVDYSGPEGLPRYWQPESGQNILVKCFEQHYTVDCVRVDPPAKQGSNTP